MTSRCQGKGAQAGQRPCQWAAQTGWESRGQAVCGCPPHTHHTQPSPSSRPYLHLPRAVRELGVAGSLTLIPLALRHCRERSGRHQLSEAPCPRREGEGRMLCPVSLTSVSHPKGHSLVDSPPQGVPGSELFPKPLVFPGGSEPVGGCQETYEAGWRGFGYPPKLTSSFLKWTEKGL